MCSAAEGVELDGGDGLGGDGHFTFQHGGFEIFGGPGEFGILVDAVEGVAFGFRESNELDAPGAIEIEEFREHFGIEGADMHEKDVGNIAFVKGLGEPAIEVEIGSGGRKVRGLKLGDRDGVGLGDAAGVWIVP
jgi:hypothetical protein